MTAPEYTADFVERGYNNRAAVPDHPRWLAKFAQLSAQTQAKLSPKLDLRYGPNAKETLDLFVPPGRRAARSSSSTAATGARSTRTIISFVAARSSTQGYAVAVINYDLCPDGRDRDDRRRMPARARLARARRAEATARQPTPLVVGGHSAGGHLAAMMFATDWREASA